MPEVLHHRAERTREELTAPQSLDLWTATSVQKLRTWEISLKLMGTIALISLGSNLGDRKGILDAAIAAIAAADDVQIRAVSSYHETMPVGGPAGQGAFLNAAVTLSTSLNPFQLLALLREIEASTGRVRTVHWGERTLDLDLLLYGEQIIDTTELTVPHRWMAVRRFVLAPLAQIAPEFIDPLSGRTIDMLLARLDRGLGYIALDLPLTQCRSVFEQLVARLTAIGMSPVTDPVANVMPQILSAQSRRHALSRLLDLGGQTLQRDRWSADVWKGRWLLTDYWLDRFFLDLVKSNESTQLGVDRESFLKLRSQVIEPTFVVAPPLEVGQLGRWSRQADADRPIGSDVPILRPRSSEPDQIVLEVVAACVASRP